MRTTSTTNTPDEQPEEDAMEKTVSEPNISCGHCVKTIERELGELPGVESVAAEAEGRKSLQ